MKSTLLLALLSSSLLSTAQQVVYPSFGDAGTTVLEMVDESRQEVYAPTPRARRLMVSLFYPAQSPELTRNCSLSAAYPPATAAFFETQTGLPTGSVAALATKACRDAPVLIRRYPIPLIFFSPPYGSSRLVYSGFAEQMAVYGYVVVTVDHPYSSGIVEYPDGELVYQRNDPSEKELLRDLDTRRKDMSFVLDQIRNNDTLLPYPVSNGRGQFDLDRVGIVGHILGGATAVSAMRHDDRFDCGASLDGPVLGRAGPNRTLDRPFLLMTAENSNRTTLPGWSRFWPLLRGFKREISVAGTFQPTFSDEPFITDLLGLRQNPSRYGTINGRRIIEIMNVYLNALFASCLKDRLESPYLSGPSSEYPEVRFAS